MDIQARKLNLIEEFLKISDESIIEKIEFFIRLDKHKKNEEALKPMTLEEFYSMINQAKQDKANGRVVSHEELKQQVNSWG